MTTYTFDECIASDLHKDARGHRPGAGWWAKWEAYSDNEKQKVWDVLIDEFNDEQTRMEELQAEAWQKFLERIQTMYAFGARNKAQAVRWILEADKIEKDVNQYGLDYACFTWGLCYSKGTELKEMLEE